jgi:Spy/CpxP family protein refolding chaperone
MMTSATLVAALALAAPAFAQAPANSAPAAGSSAEKAPAQQPTGKSSNMISKIQVIDVKQLPDAVKSQVEEIVAKSSDEDMQALRKSIDGSPAATGALKEKGLTSALVVAINIADGVLTMFAKVA